MSTLKVNTIRHTGASSDAVTLATDGTCTAKITNSLSNRNKIINGAQVVDQRGLATEATPAHDAYLTDRWNAHLSQGSKYKVQQVTESPAGFTNSLKVTSLSAYTPLAADYFLINQYIEGYNMSDLGWGAVGAKTVTISFWVRSSVTGNYALALRQPWNRAQNQSYTISSADTWEKKSLTFTGDTSGTWNTTNGQGMSVGFILGGGSNYEATSGSWGAGSHFRFSGATNLVATNAATFYVTGVQLEVGDVATDFEHRSYGDELARCQRYYETHNHLTTAKTTDGDVTSYWSTITSNDSNTLVVSTGIIYKVPKRASPTVTIYNSSDTSTAARVNAQGTERTVNATYGGPHALTRIYVLGASAGNYVTYNWEASAEL